MPSAWWSVLTNRIGNDPDEGCLLEIVKCGRCRAKVPLLAFPRKANLKVSKTCAKCLEKEAVRRAGQRGDAKENTRGSEQMRKDVTTPANDRLPTLAWEAFISLLRENHAHACELDTFVKKPGREPLRPAQDDRATMHDRAVEVSKVVRDATGYRFK
jgi:hypothetical protein